MGPSGRTSDSWSVSISTGMGQGNHEVNIEGSLGIIQVVFFNGQGDSRIKANLKLLGDEAFLRIKRSHVSFVVKGHLPGILAHAVSCTVLTLVKHEIVP